MLPDTAYPIWFEYVPKAHIGPAIDARENVPPANSGGWKLCKLKCPARMVLDVGYRLRIATLVYEVSWLA